MEIFHEEADKQEISLNALLNKVMKDYSKYRRWLERFGVVLISHPTFARLIDCSPENNLKDAAKKPGSMGLINSLQSIGIPPTFDTLLGFIENNLGASAKWFDYSDQIIGKRRLFIYAMK